MEVTVLLIEGQLVLLAIQFEFTMGNPIGKTADNGPKVGWIVFHVILNRIKAEGNIVWHADFIRYLQLDKDSPVIEECSPQATFILQCERLYFPSIRELADCFLVNFLWHDSNCSLRWWAFYMSGGLRSYRVDLDTNADATMCKTKMSRGAVAPSRKWPIAEGTGPR